jgi:hypothetical protein
MHKFLPTISSILLLAQVSAMADNLVDAENHGEDVDVHVFVTTEEALDLSEKYDDSMPQQIRKKVRVIKTATTKDMDRQYQASDHRLMSADAANCVLKNISKVNNNAAAHLLRQACSALNQSEQ